MQITITGYLQKFGTFLNFDNYYDVDALFFLVGHNRKMSNKAY